MKRFFINTFVYIGFIIMAVVIFQGVADESGFNLNYEIQRKIPSYINVGGVNVDLPKIEVPSFNIINIPDIDFKVTGISDFFNLIHNLFTLYPSASSTVLMIIVCFVVYIILTLPFGRRY